MAIAGALYAVTVPIASVNNILPAVNPSPSDLIQHSTARLTAEPMTLAPQVSSNIVHTLLTSGNNTVNQKIYSTASIAPAANTLITVAVLGHNATTAPASPTLSGGGMTTWTQVATITFDSVATPLKRLTIFRAMRSSPGQGSLTITFSANVSNCQWIVSQWRNVDISGSNGANAIGQTSSNRANPVNGLTVTLPAFSNPNNVAYGVFAVKQNVLAVTPGTGFTEIAERPSGESPLSDLQAQWANNDNTIDASWSNLAGGALGIEIKAAATGPAVSSSQSRVTASPTSITAGTETSTITVTAKDANGSPISGATVVLSATGTGNSLIQPVGPTDASGVASGTLSSTAAGAKTVSAIINGTTINESATVTAVSGPVSASQSTVVAAPISISPGSGTSTITVTAKDANGNRISGATVLLAATGSVSVLTQPVALTNSNGETTGALSSTVEEMKVVSATIDGTAITQTATVQVAAQTAATIFHKLLTFGNNSSNQRVYTTATITPAAQALVTVAVLMRRSDGPLNPTITGGGMSAWERVTSLDFDTQTSPTKRLSIFRALSPSPSSGRLTITFSRDVNNVQWIVSQWDGVETSGTNGSGAIAQIGTARSNSANSLTVPLDHLSDANNVAYGVVGVASNGPIVTPALPFTEIAEQSSGESSTLQAEWATNQHTVGANWSSANRAGMLAIEIKAGNTQVEPVVSVDVTPASASVAVGGTVQLTATAQNAEGETLIGRTFSWATDAPSTATVSTGGLVTGVGTGEATITATSEGKIGTARVTVATNAAAVASVDVTPASASIVVGGTVQLTATAKDAAGQALPGRTITWGSNASGVASVSSTGLVTGVLEGSANVSAMSEGKIGMASITVTTGSQSALLGSWSPVIPAPTVQIHTHLLVNGKVLIFGRTGVHVWDPATGIFTEAPSPSLLFCAGHDFLPDGRLLVTGGHISPNHGLPNTNIFDFRTGSWQAGPPMAQGRWYPTNTTLPSGEVLTLSGEDENGDTVNVPEIWDGSSWRQLTTASLALANYPRTFVAPDGRVFYAGADRQSRYLDVTGTGSWSNGPLRQFGSRSYGAAVMYEPGKILYVGGNNPPTNTTEIIDLNQPSPQWTYTGSLAYARWNLNATVLPTGEVLVTSGVSGDRSNASLAVHAAELWSPVTGTWTTLASSASLLRGYHSTSLLLPDGRVLHGGGGGGGGTIDNLNYEIYSPPYLFKGERPVITGTTPESLGYGQTLFVETAAAASITKVTFIRFGSVTHAFDAGTRLIPLSFSQGTGGLSVTLPASRVTAPPGPYMLFLVNGNGVPSVGRIMLLQ
jgi:uncharacterized protein YjdB